MESYLHVDFETASDLELREVGVYKYATDPSTRILCMSWFVYASTDGVWYPIDGGLPLRVVEWVEGGGRLSAWNAAFERVIWHELGVCRHGFPRVDFDRWHNPQAVAMLRNFPASLEGSGVALNAPVRKDKEGAKLMRVMAKGGPGDLIRLGKYCLQDTHAEYSIHARLDHQDLPAREKRIYRISERINDRGVAIDREFAEAAATAVKHYQHDVGRECESRFGISPAQVKRIREVAASHRIELPDLRADTVDEVLDAAEFYPDNIVRLLRYRQQFAAVSPKKYAAMLRAVCFDDRLRGMFSYAGAGQTTRWSSRIVQLHNLPRPTMPYECVRQAMERLRHEKDYRCLYEFGEPLEVLLNALRPTFVPQVSDVFTSGDESQIEARVLPWLARDWDTLNVFRGGGDIYLYSAESIFGFQVRKTDKVERQIGKVATLSLGYQGGKKAFQSMGRNYGVRVSEEKADAIKVAWRDAHEEIVGLWASLQSAAMQAIGNPGKTFEAGPYLRFRHNGSALWMQLPSGRSLCYPRAHLRMAIPKWELDKPEEERKARLTICYYSPAGDNMVLDFTYGGKLVENATQAVARDVLAEAMLRESDLPYVLHVHDELVTEGDHRERLLAALTAPISWAPGLPLAADVTLLDRYHKED